LYLHLDLSYTEKLASEFKVEHSDPKLRFPVPFNCISRGAILSWLFRKPREFAGKWIPFLDRQDYISSLLHTFYLNQQREKKVYHFFTTAPGFGKTRLLLEWAIQVFHQPIIAYRFLRDLDNDDDEPKIQSWGDLEKWWENKEKTNEQRERAGFLNEVYRSLMQGNTIFFDSSLLDTKADAAQGNES